MTPQDFEDRVIYWQIRLATLGLGHWFFEYTWDDEAVPDALGRDADATIRVHESYDTAFWHVPMTTLEMEPLEIDKIIVHELMHVAMRDLNKVERDMLYTIGGTSSDHYDMRLDGAIESLVERLARAIVATSSNLVP